jgi:DNA-binding MarR family transcriptional regulator
VDLNGINPVARYTLSTPQQAEAIRDDSSGEKTQSEIAELFNLDRSTISRMMTEVRLKEQKKAGLL